MYKTYNATVRGNQIEWETDSPPVDTEEGIQVQITVLKQFKGTEEERKAKLRAALKKLASLPSSFQMILLSGKKRHVKTAHCWGEIDAFRQQYRDLYTQTGI